MVAACDEELEGLTVFDCQISPDYIRPEHWLFLLIR